MQGASEKISTFIIYNALELPFVAFYLFAKEKFEEFRNSADIW